ncbi:hypothetical protein HDV00_003246 [Rhizophlyctis rosea]|nr:hypothetical protein HDV00_003246 [Rhizophlyctis rosea]
MGCGASKNNTDQTLKTTQKGPEPGYEKEAAPAGALAKSISQAIVNQASHKDGDIPRLESSASDIAAASGVQERRDSKGRLPQAQLDHAEVTATVTQQGTENRPEIITADISATAHVPTAHTSTKSPTAAEAGKSGSKHSLKTTGADAEKSGSKHSLKTTGADAEKSGSKHSLKNLVHHEKTATNKEDHERELAKEHEKENHQHHIGTTNATSPTTNREDFEKELAKEREKENHQPTSATDTSPTTTNPDAVDTEEDLDGEELETDDDEAASDAGDAEVAVSGQIQVGVNKKPQKRRRKKRAPITNQVVTTRSRASSLDADPHAKETKGHVKKSTQSLGQAEGKGSKNLAGSKNQVAGSRETLGRKKEAAA